MPTASFNAALAAAEAKPNASPGYQAAAKALYSATQQADMGNRAAAVKALSFAQNQLPSMTLAERTEMSGLIAKTTSEVYRPRTTQEVQAGRKEFDDWSAQHVADIRAENRRTGGVDPGDKWWRPGAWGFGLPGEAPSLSTKLLWIGGGLVGLYFFSKILNYMTAGRQVQAARYSTAQAALSMNPKRRRRRRRR